MRNALIRFAKDTRGTATLEYGLLAAGIALVMFAAIQALGLGLGEIYQAIVSGLQSVNSGR
jgi:pilus assembly protein Flp/PilA